MSIILNVDLQISQTSKLLGSGFKKQINRAAVRGMNTSMQKTRVQAKRNIVEATSIKAGIVNKNLKVKRASPRFMRASLEALPYVPNLIEFMTSTQAAAAQVRKVRRGNAVPTPKGAGITARVYGSRKLHKGAFVGRAKRSGQLQVFTRTGAGRNATLKPVYGATVIGAFLKPAINKALKQTSRRVFVKEFHRQVKLALRKG